MARKYTINHFHSQTIKTKGVLIHAETDHASDIDKDHQKDYLRYSKSCSCQCDKKVKKTNIPKPPKKSTTLIEKQMEILNAAKPIGSKADQQSQFSCRQEETDFFMPFKIEMGSGFEGTAPLNK